MNICKDSFGENVCESGRLNNSFRCSDAAWPVKFELPRFGLIGYAVLSDSGGGEDDDEEEDVG